jgi:plasmid stabilization system protein ParE
MKISFTKRAEKNYRSIKEYITNEWGEKVAGAFEQKTIDFLDLLEDFPEIGVVEVIEKQIRGFQLIKQTRVFYRIKGDNYHLDFL